MRVSECSPGLSPMAGQPAVFSAGVRMGFSLLWLPKRLSCMSGVCSPHGWAAVTAEPLGFLQSTVPGMGNHIL